MNGKDIDPSIMKQYSQGEGFDDQSTDTAQKKEASVGVKKTFISSTCRCI